MKKNIISVLLVSFVFIFSGCSKSSDSSVSVIMNVPIDKVGSIDLYSGGQYSELSNDSRDYKKLLELLRDNESDAGLIDGGLGIDMADVQAEGYDSFSKKENIRVYIFNFSEKQHVKYNDYVYDSDNVTGVFVVPEKNYFGYIIQSADSGNISYATFMSDNKAMFAGF